MDKAFIKEYPHYYLNSILKFRLITIKNNNINNEKSEIAEKLMGKNEEILWQGVPYGRRSKKDSYYISTKRIFSIIPGYTTTLHSFDYGLIQYFVSDIEFFFIRLKKRGDPNIYNLYFKTYPIHKENLLKMLLNCNINKELPLDDEFYITFVPDNGWCPKGPDECLILMERIIDIEHISIVLRNNLGIKEETSPPDLKLLYRKVVMWDFHSWY
jgi:hypothetical protein